MLKNKNVNIILALIIAISLWSYVIGDVNPRIDITIKDVPIELVNEDTLTNSDLVVLGCSQYSINITVSGPRTKVTQIQKSDFEVTADVEALSVGDNVVRLHVVGPDNGEITDISTEKINITVDSLVSEEKNINVVFQGVIDSGKEPLVVDISQNTINVTGAKSLVDTVSSVNAVIDATQVESTMRTLQATLHPVDAEGNVVEYVSLEADVLNVTTIMHHTKTVDLVVPVENDSEGGYERTLTAPKTVVIKGEEDDISKVESITCKSVDLGEFTENSTVELVPILPNGINLSDDASILNAKVAVKPLSKVNIKVQKNNIELVNAVETLQYDVVAEDISIEVVGKESDIKTMDISSFTITADVEGLGAGEHTVKLNITSNIDYATINLLKDEINIIIK
ncbi:MAG: hypothetical protein IKU67_01490 [Firmicutes bacterium]|nr:hypothetical protein [Bacillota bacterium]